MVPPFPRKMVSRNPAALLTALGSVPSAINARALPWSCSPQVRCGADMGVAGHGDFLGGILEADDDAAVAFGDVGFGAHPAPQLGFVLKFMRDMDNSRDRGERGAFDDPL